VSQGALMNPWLHLVQTGRENRIMGKEVPMCADCPIRAKAEARPRSLIGRLWLWHTKWCPGWKAYQEYLAQS
jgi:hypothetical protein